MAKHVIVIASGETERRAVPHLVAHLKSVHIIVDEVRIPPGNRALDVSIVQQIVTATWFQRAANPPDKFVLLVDADGNAPEDVLRPFRQQLASHLNPKITASLQFAHAQWHLEAWYFADAAGLRNYLQHAPGSVDTSKPDEISNPKLHLKNLLGDRTYTAVIAEQIARGLAPAVIAQRSPSFRGFLDAVRNGNRNDAESSNHDAKQT